jgi:tripartite-type tricarboxylate transporter receptor subunit TctC
MNASPHQKPYIKALAARFLLPALMFCLSSANAQDFPNRPVRFVVPFAAGGSTDVIARVIAQKLQERWGQAVVVDNKPGAATVIGTDFVAKSRPDGHTILLTPGAFAVAPYTFEKLPYDTRRDFAPISLLLKIPLVVAVNPGVVSARSMPSLVAELRSQPGKVSYGSPGNGSLSHLAGELFKLQTATDMVHVPYKGAALVINDLLGGQIGLTFTSPIEVSPHMKAGKLLMLGVASPLRLVDWPDVPTLIEGGLPDFEASFWFGVTAAAGTPRDIIEKINAGLLAALKSPDVSEKLVAQGAVIAGTTPQAFAQFLESEHSRWSAAAKAAQIKFN